MKYKILKLKDGITRLEVIKEFRRRWFPGTKEALDMLRIIENNLDQIYDTNPKPGWPHWPEEENAYPEYFDIDVVEKDKYEERNYGHVSQPKPTEEEIKEANYWLESLGEKEKKFVEILIGESPHIVCGPFA